MESKSILEMNHEEAKNFLLKEESYCTLALPTYYRFDEVLEKSKDLLEKMSIDDIELKGPESASNTENVNYSIFTNKDGHFSWRKIQLINPLLYVDLVNQISEETKWNEILSRIEDLKNSNITVQSFPREAIGDRVDTAENIINWLSQVEQESISKSLKFINFVSLDITDCYGSIYTHSIPWALHTKEEAKKNRNSKALIGNVIDKSITRMQYAQTNGIPQGSVLMDFIAEIVLSYADSLIASKIEKAEIDDYHIIRYRDDYRIFSNNKTALLKIVKIINEELQELNFKLNNNKTIISDDIISSSIKQDKMNFNKEKNILEYSIVDEPDTYHQKYLLDVYRFSIKHPNTGSLVRLLNQYTDHIKDYKNQFKDIRQTISIIAEIIINNPTTIVSGVNTLAKLISLLKEKDQTEIIKVLNDKFENIPNSTYLKIWLDRITIKINSNDEKAFIFKGLNGKSEDIWNFKWVEETDQELKSLKETRIFRDEINEELKIDFSDDEVKRYIRIFSRYEFD